MSAPVQARPEFVLRGVRYTIISKDNNEITYRASTSTRPPYTCTLTEFESQVTAGTIHMID